MNIRLSHLFLLGAISLPVACKSKNQFAPPPPMAVEVQVPIIRDQQTYSEFPGSVQAVEVVAINARVKGILKTVTSAFKPGETIKEGTLLFEIDDISYQADVRDANAELAKAKSSQKIAEITLKRRKMAGQGISRLDVETAQANVDQTKAAVQSAQAKLITAEETLGYCKISAPITGRISELKIDQFNLVGSQDAIQLCSIVRDNYMYIHFEVNERASLVFLRHRKESKKQKILGPQCSLTLADGTTYDHLAQIQLTDNRIDPETGTLRIRAIVSNPDGKLADGLFVRIQVPRREARKKAILVPTVAIQEDLGGPYVLVVNSSDKVVRKNIKLADRVGRLRIVASGLKGDEKVIIKGLQRVREGSPVKPTETKPADASQSAK